MGKSIYKLIKNLYNNLLDIIYPPKEVCITCNTEGFVGICPLCKSSIKRATVKYESAISYGFYGGILKKLILEFKYGKNFIAGHILAYLLSELIIEEEINADMICYVPMTKKSIKKRGFNQCKLISQRISSKVDLPVSNCLIKIVNTREQKTLNKEERIANVKNVFKVKEPKNIRGKNIILIDDVMTTGATVNECKKILKKSGANEIIILTIAKSNI